MGTRAASSQGRVGHRSTSKTRDGRSGGRARQINVSDPVGAHGAPLRALCTLVSRLERAVNTPVTFARSSHGAFRPDFEKSTTSLIPAAATV
jgi:hypothetical protein